MGRLITILMLLYLLFSSKNSFSQIKESESLHSIDSIYHVCLDLNGTTMGMILCADTAAKAWDKELNKYYSLLMKSLSAESKEKLKLAQRNWILYKDAELKYANQMYLDMQGTMYKVIAADRFVEIVKQRALELKFYYEVITD